MMSEVSSCCVTHCVIALLQRRCPQSDPNILPVHSPSHLQCYLKIAALDGQVESGLLILHEVKRDLGVTLLLQIPDNALADKIAVSDDLQDLVVVLPDQSELESVLGRIDGDGTRLGGAVETVDDLALDASEVDRLVEGFNDAIVTIYVQLVAA